MEDEFQGTLETEGVRKNFMFLNRKAPYGSIYAQEIQEMVLISAAFEQNTAVVFMDDGVYQIKKGQDTSATGMKNFSPTYGIFQMEKEDAEEDEDVDVVWHIVVEKESMEARGLTPEDFVIDVEVMDAAELQKLMAEQDVILTG